jgi:ribosome-associated heat shock protein Hsp15
MRLDVWLWVARLAKTRAIAADACKGGRVHVNGQAAKPAKELRLGDEVEVKIVPWRTVVVREFAPRRLPAKEAVLLYEETPESIAARERLAEERRLAPPPLPVPGGRPTKRARRRFETGR